MKRLVVLLSLALAAASSLVAADFPTNLAKGLAGRSPYNLIGQLFFASGGDDYIGTGIVIRPSSILTAGHNLYDADHGWSTDILFRRGAYGNSVKSESYGSRIYLLGGYRQNATLYGSDDVRAFSADTGGVRFPRKLAAGGYAGWTTDTSMITNKYRYKIAIGYGAEGSHTGNFPMYVEPSQGFSSAWGAFYESRGAYFEGGMSGGPLFALNDSGQLLVAALVVSGTESPYYSGGVRIFNSGTANFIGNYLR